MQATRQERPIMTNQQVAESEKFDGVVMDCYLHPKGGWSVGDTYKIKVIKADTGEVVKTFEAVTERAARAPAESVQRDAERLDFVERHPEMSLRHRKGKWAFLGFTNYEYDLHQSLREAIDAAIAAQGGSDGL